MSSTRPLSPSGVPRAPLSTPDDRTARTPLPRGILATVCSLVLLGISAGLSPAVAQEGTVTGEVVDASSLQPLADVQVFIADTDLGTLTDDDGRFRITGVPSGSVDLRARLVGYRPAARQVEVSAGEVTDVELQMSVSAISMGELVVTATGRQRNRELGNVVSTIDGAEQAERKRSSTLTNLIQGESAGVTVRRSSGSPGAASTLRIRGNSSISLDNTPLVYVDGARIANDSPDSGQQGQEFSRLNDISPDDIESIEIVKGPAASTLYGTEAAAGVVRITTKQGSGGGTRIRVRGEAGSNRDVTDWMDVAWHPRSLLGEAAHDTVYTMNLLEAPGNPFRTGTAGTVATSIRGGGGEDISRYYLSGEWKDEQGVLPNSGLRRWSFRGNFSLEPYDWLQVDASNGFVSSFTALPDNDNNIAGFIPIALVSFPWTKPMEVDGVETCPLNIETARITSGVEIGDLGFAGCAERPTFGGRSFDQVASRLHQQDVERYTGSVTAVATPLEWMTGRFTVGYDEFAQRTRFMVPVDPNLPFADLSEGFIDRVDQTRRNLTLEANVSAAFDLTEEVRSTTTVGGQWFNERLEATEAVGRNFPAGAASVGNSVVNEGDDAFVEERTLGIFLQQQLGWRDRLFLTPAIRFDDNSAFGANTDVQALKKINASYVISDEDWFPEAFEALKLRAAWGQSAKQPGTNDALSLLGPAPTIFQGEEQLGVLPQRPGNQGLRPERGEEFELGFDSSILDGRIGFTFTYYDQTTRDAIVAKELAPSRGFPDQQFTNIGEIVNSGLEMSLDARAIDRTDLTWDWRINFTTNDNEITDLSEPIIFDFGNDSNNGQRHQEGRPFGAYVWEEVFIGPDGSVQVGDELRTVGQPTPSWEGSVSSSVTLLEHVSVHALLDFMGGFETSNTNASFLCQFLGGGQYGGTCPDLFEVGPDGEPTELARRKQVASAIRNEDPWIESADFAKLRNVSVRLQMPGDWIRRLPASAASLTLTGENLVTWTGYSGHDPEANEFGDHNAARGDFLTLPPAQRFVASLSLTF